MSGRYCALVVVVTLLLSWRTASSRDLSRVMILDIPPEIANVQFGKIPPSTLTAADTAAIASFRYTADTLKVIAVHCGWTDRPMIFPTSRIDSLLFSHHVYPGGSVADYFEEVSYGKTTIIGQVVTYNINQPYSPNFDFETILPALDGIIDFSKFDANHDGVVDACIFIRSGTGQEDSHNSNDIWSYAYIYSMGSGPGPFDGEMISRWNTCPEAFPVHDSASPPDFTGEVVLDDIRVFSHEFTHNLGLPDLYDYDSKLTVSTFYTPNDANDHPVYDWDLMGFGGYGILSIRGANPSHLCGFNKSQLGWIQPDVLTPGTYHLTIKNIETTTDSALFVLPIRGSSTEYFTLEYRNPKSTAQYDKFDSDFSVYFYDYLTYGCDPLDRGLLIMHIDEGVSSWSNNGTPLYPHYRVMVEDAGYNPAKPHTYNPLGHVTDTAQWWYPYESRKGALFSSDVPGQTVFSPTTTPSSAGYYALSGITVTVDSMAGERLFATVTWDTDGDGVSDEVDNCDLVSNPGQEDTDHDGLGNACDVCPTDPLNDVDNDLVCGSIDNCPTVANANQQDSDRDGIGNACDNCPAIYNPDQTDLNHDGVGDVCCCTGTTGNVNMQGIVDVSDLSLLVTYLTTNPGPDLPCLGEANVNKIGIIDVSDLSLLIAFLTAVPSPALPYCY